MQCSPETKEIEMRGGFAKKNSNITQTPNQNKAEPLVVLSTNKKGINKNVD